MERFLQWSAKLYQKPWPILLFTLLVTIVLVMGIPKLKVNNDVKAMLPENNRERVISDYYDSEECFGSSNAIFVGIESPNIYSLETLTYVKNLKDKIENLNNVIPQKDYANLLHLTYEEGQTVIQALRSVGINDLNYKETLVKLIKSSDALQKQFSWNKDFADKVSTAANLVPDKKLFTLYDNPLGKVQSIVNADFITYEDDALVSKKLIDNEELSPGNIQGLKSRVNSWDTYEGAIVSKDATLTSIIVMLKTDDSDAKTAVNDDLQKFVENPPANIKVFTAGEPIVVDQLGRAMAHDIPVLMPLVILVIVLLLFYCFRSIKGIIFPLIVTVVAILWTVGLMGYFNIPMTSVSSTLPVLLMAIVSAYGIHQMNHYYEDPQRNKLKVLTHNIKSVGLAILLSGITVMVGFGALVTQDFVPIKNFGIFTAIGDLIGVVGALYLLPALLLLGKSEKVVPKYHAEGKKDLIARLLHGTVSLSQKHSKSILVAVSIIGIVLLIGAFSVKSELDVLSFFKADTPIQLSDKIMNEKMAGTKSLNIILDSDLRDPVSRKGNAAGLTELATPNVLKKIDQFSIDLRKKYPSVQKVSSFSDVLKKMNQEMNGGDPSAYVIPNDQALISQYLVIFSGDTKSFLTTNHDKLRISITMNSGSSDEIHEIANYSEAYLGKDFQNKNHLQVIVTGAQQIEYAANQTLLRGTLESIIICIVIVFLLLIFILRSFWMSFIGIVPIFLCLLVDFGLLGFGHISLNAATALVSSVGIGIGVDFSIHFITWYRRELQIDYDVCAALDRTIVNKGRAILYNLFVIVGGFLVLLASNLIPLGQFGLITAVCMTVTAAGALLIVPAILRLLSKTKVRFIYLGLKQEEAGTVPII